MTKSKIICDRCHVDIGRGQWGELNLFSMRYKRWRGDVEWELCPACHAMVLRFVKGEPLGQILAELDEDNIDEGE